MTEFTGSVATRVANILVTEGAIVAGVVIDEQTANWTRTNDAQARLLESLASWYCPVFLVELNPSLKHQDKSKHKDTKPTQARLRTAAGGWVSSVRKAYLNATVNTPLVKKLRELNITYVVVMGQQTNCCVKRTAIGGDDIDRATYDGLVDNGFRILTARDIVQSGAPAEEFHTHDELEFYASSG